MVYKKRILHIIQSLDNGGCENMLLRTLPLLQDEFEHQIIALKELGELAPQFKQNNIMVTTVNQHSLFYFVSYHKLLLKIRQFNPSVIITYLFHADMIGRFLLQHKIFVPVVPFLRTTYNHPKYRIARFFERMTKNLVLQYIANSESVKNFYIHEIGVNPKKITVIPNGMDFDFYDNIPRDENLRKNFNINQKEIVIICVANFHINKGHTYLLEAFENVYRFNKNIKLLLVGDGEEKENFLKQVEKYQSKNNILFLGKRKDVPKLLKISDIFVLSTMFEGMSNAIIEAMASGLPIITTDIPENRELIKHNEEGVLVPVKNSSILVMKLILLLSNQVFRRYLGDSARDKIRKNFSLIFIAEQWKNFLVNIR